LDPEDESQVAGVVTTLPMGIRKTGTWNFRKDGVTATDLLLSRYYIAIHLNTGDIRSPIKFQERPDSGNFDAW
jgi:hypothetical protein